MKKCFIGLTIVGCLALIIVIIAVAVSGGGKDKMSCPPYHYRDPDVKAEIGEHDPGTRGDGTGKGIKGRGGG